jgi:hypothetical protein
VLPCSTAAETVIHIEKTWERGQVRPAPQQPCVPTTTLTPYPVYY